jgi:hypothetical protein
MAILQMAESTSTVRHNVMVVLLRLRIPFVNGPYYLVRLPLVPLAGSAVI